MANVSIYSSMPRTVFRGISDTTATVVSMPVVTLPIELPLFMDFAPWGEENKARFVNQAGLNLLYGAETTDPNGPYFTHQSQFVRSNFTSGANALFLRVVGEGIKQASMRFGIDMVADLIPVYERNPDGSYRRDANGDRIPTGDTVQGYRLQNRKVEIPTIAGVNNFGLGANSEGWMVSEDSGATSTFYPTFDGMARWRGKRGNDLGVRFSAPTTAFVDPGSAAVNERVGSFLYRIEQVQRADAFSTPTTVAGWAGNPFLNFSFTPLARDPNTRVVYDINKTLLKSFEGPTPEEFRGWGHFSRIHTYNNHFTTILEMLAEAEEAITGEPINPNEINFMTGVDVNGIPYHSFVVEGPEEGGLLMTETSTHYFVGGDDGVLGNEEYNRTIDALLSGLATYPVPLYDIAAYPYNSVWDSGFPLDTKEKFVEFHNLRPDVIVFACTQDVLLPKNTPTEDASIGVALRNVFRAQQESYEFGTKALRFATQMNAGYLINSDYDGLVPFLEDTCIRLGAYAGGGNGSLNPAYSFGRGQQNIISRYRDHNVVSRPPEARNVDWNNGLIYAESFDIGDRIFVPAYQSMYENHTSVLHSMVNVVILNNLTRVGHIVWRNWVGDSKLTNLEFKEAVEQNVLDLTRDKYDGRAEVQPNLYWTSLDQELNFSYHLDIDAALDGMKLVEHLAIIAGRRSVAVGN